MTATRWQRVKTLFAEARVLPPERRGSFLAERAGPATRSEVTSLLAGDDPDFLAPPEPERLAELAGSEDGPLAAGTRIGHYEIVALIGVGGMGSVYRARRSDRVFEKAVAIKVMQHGLNAPDAAHRFALERQTLATLDHPHIARLLDGGTTDDCRPYLVMELVEGRPIDAYCDDKRLDVRARLTLFRTVCAAVVDAHRKLIVHRDLKPANILVADDGTVKLVDFGISRVLPEDGAPDATVTTHRALTPEYASPEQIRGEPVTTASDVFSLGLVLYRLLAGRGPWTTRDRPRYAIEQAICETPPPPPSTVAARTRGTRTRRILAGDLDTIVVKALGQRLERRYASVEQLDSDIARYLAGRPVRARKDTFAYRAVKLVRRRTLETAAVTVAVLALLVALGGVGFGYVNARRAEGVAARQRDAAREALRFYQDMLATSNPYRSREPVSILQLLAGAETRIETELAGQPQVEAGVRLAMAQTYVNMMNWPEAAPHLRRSIALLEAADEPDVDALSRALNLYGRTLTHLRNPTAAAVHRRALALNRDLFGEEHARVAASIGCLGFAQWSADPRNRQWHAAEGHYLESLAMMERLGLGETADAARFTMSLGCMYAAQRRDDEAETRYRAALAIYDALPFTEDRYQITTMNLLATVLERGGRLDEAADLLRDSRAMLPRGISDRDDCRMSWQLALLASRRGDDAAAAPEFRRALALECALLAASDPPDAYRLRLWEDRLRAADEVDALPGTAPRVIGRVAVGYGQDVALLTVRFAGLARHLDRTNARDEAAAVLRSLLEAQQETLSPDNPLHRKTRDRLESLLDGRA